MGRGNLIGIPGWERFGWLRAGFSGRPGGLSTVFGGKSLNLGWKEEDADANVSENRRRFVHAVWGNEHIGDAVRLVTVRQVHADAIRVVRSGDGPLATENGRALLEGDGLLTEVADVLLGIQVADCVPVLVADTRRRVVGGFHAGWRGTLARIVEKGVARMREVYGSETEDMVAAIGPSIGPCCYSVGEEVRSGFEGGFGYGAELFWVRLGVEEGDHLDLWEANRRQLVEAGVPVGEVTVLRECTACARGEDGERRYFSHRAEMGRTGRMMAGIGIVEV